MFAAEWLSVLAAAAGEAAEHGGGGGSLFPEKYHIVWATINFLVLLWLLNKFLFKPLLGVVSAREQEIEGNLNKAAADRAEADRLRKEFAAQIESAQRQAQEILQQATSNARTTADQLVEEARAKAMETVARAQETIAREKERAVAELREEVATLALAVAGKVLDRSINDEDHTRLAQKFVAEVGKH